ncbi:hypothetical protein [Catalinimonas niigatensis]|uniref:hypothetical protein n=1 Tax=Catalinimonas niigatensis TaxID=1397264 RepID=UPI002665EBFE|nr:hypothetical protein [Catalinimonas niigatensis]WPP48583.1 hypothetical protein PZB72_18085 [Catalinimonas niigatensis]
MKVTSQLLQQTAFVFLMAALLSACASSKQAANSPVGTWDYMVKNTPYGDVQGQMMISQDDDGYTGEIRSNRGTISLKDISIEGNQLNSTAMLDGTQLDVKGTFEGDTFTGEISAGGNDTFPMTASRASGGK